MAKADFKLPDEFLLKISRLGSDFDSVADSVLQAGGEVVLDKVQRSGTPTVNTAEPYGNAITSLTVTKNVRHLT